MEDRHVRVTTIQTRWVPLVPDACHVETPNTLDSDSASATYRVTVCKLLASLSFGLLIHQVEITMTMEPVS